MLTETAPHEKSWVQIIGSCERFQDGEKVHIPKLLAEALIREGRARLCSPPPWEGRGNGYLTK